MITADTARAPLSDTKFRSNRSRKLFTNEETLKTERHIQLYNLSTAESKTIVAVDLAPTLTEDTTSRASTSSEQHSSRQSDDSVDQSLGLFKIDCFNICCFRP